MHTCTRARMHTHTHIHTHAHNCFHGLHHLQAANANVCVGVHTHSRQFPCLRASPHAEASLLLCQGRHTCLAGCLCKRDKAYSASLIGLKQLNQYSPAPGPAAPAAAAQPVRTYTNSHALTHGLEQPCTCLHARTQASTHKHIHILLRLHTLVRSSTCKHVRTHAHYLRTYTHVRMQVHT